MCSCLATKRDTQGTGGAAGFWTAAANPTTVRIVTEIHDLTVTELAAAIRRRELSPVQITAHYLNRMERLNATVGAFFTVTAELAADQAAAAE